MQDIEWRIRTDYHVQGTYHGLLLPRSFRCGAIYFLLKQTCRQTTDSVFPDDNDLVVDYESLGELDFGYCTEFFIINIKPKTTLTDIDKLRDYLNDIGNSVICIGDLSLVKVHTNNPGKALSKALTLGELDRVKIENMMEQNRQLRAKYEAERKPIGILAVCAGQGFQAIFKDLLVDQVIEGGQSMNPSADDVAQACKKIYAENIIILPNNKNIILSDACWSPTATCLCCKPRIFPKLLRQCLASTPKQALPTTSRK